MLAKAPNRKRAEEYLTASGATAISIVECDGVCSFHVGSKINPRAVSVQWLPETTAQAIARLARKHAGKNPDAATAARALAQAAADLWAMLTPHHIAMTRARDAAARIGTASSPARRPPMRLRKGPAHFLARPVNSPVAKWRVSRCFKRETRPASRGPGCSIAQVGQFALIRLRAAASDQRPSQETCR
jgi:hypothetical protein